MDEFSKRRYHRPSELTQDLLHLARHARELGPVVTGRVVKPAFRERLMLAVTGVNDCRYCAYGHARAALAAGVPRSEVDQLLAGDLEGALQDQVPALLYAQHWAETDAEPDPVVRHRLLQTYGEPMTRQIELTMRLIRVGNLTGNTVDYLLRRIRAGADLALRALARGRRSDHPRDVRP